MKSSTLGRALQALRKTRGGPAKKLEECPKCGKMLGSRERRQRCPEHATVNASRP